MLQVIYMVRNARPILFKISKNCNIFDKFAGQKNPSTFTLISGGFFLQNFRFWSPKE